MSSEKITATITVTPEQWERIKQIIGDIPAVDRVVLKTLRNQPPPERKEPSARMKGF